MDGPDCTRIRDSTVNRPPDDFVTGAGVVLLLVVN
jgi:hypothetical protein